MRESKVTIPLYSIYNFLVYHLLVLVSTLVALYFVWTRIHSVLTIIVAFPVYFVIQIIVKFLTKTAKWTTVGFFCATGLLGFAMIFFGKPVLPTYVIVGVVFVGLCLWYRWLYWRDWIKQSRKAIAVIKLGMTTKLLRSYKHEYTEDTAAKLADAVVNELFSDPPSTSETAAFLEENAALVEQAIDALRTDRGWRSAVTLVVYAKRTVAFTEGKRELEDQFEPITKLIQLGLFMPEEQPSGEAFLALANFYCDYLQISRFRE